MDIDWTFLNLFYLYFLLKFITAVFMLAMSMVAAVKAGGYGHYKPHPYKFGYHVKQGDYHSDAYYQYNQDPYHYDYSVKQTHPYGGYSQIYHYGAPHH